MLFVKFEIKSFIFYYNYYCSERFVILNLNLADKGLWNCMTVKGQ